MTSTPIIFLTLTRSNDEIRISSPRLERDAHGLTYYFERDKESVPVRFGVPVMADLGGEFSNSVISAANASADGQSTPWTDVTVVDGGTYRLSPPQSVNADLTIEVTAKATQAAGNSSGGAYVRLRRQGGGGPL